MLLNFVLQNRNLVSLDGIRYIWIWCDGIEFDVPEFSVTG